MAGAGQGSKIPSLLLDNRSGRPMAGRPSRVDNIVRAHEGNSRFTMSGNITEKQVIEKLLETGNAILSGERSR